MDIGALKWQKKRDDDFINNPEEVMGISYRDFNKLTGVIKCWHTFIWSCADRNLKVKILSVGLRVLIELLKIEVCYFTYLAA